ncbi:RidA family protein [Shewanella psychropiezotolerans]|uniref:RidA family protein n=2 Tax=Shewanellaceae TaxID=267890 RepID=A0ABX5X577_9GAMM|nr:RidA family protein [Shewanella sp. YLB-07]QDO86498.1 RidA family protein [Shewanella psychropiezotolerans]
MRIKRLGLTLPDVASALGNYEPYCIVGNTLMTSGQFPYLNGELQYQGQLGREFSLEQGYQACRLAALNAIAQLKQACGDLSQIKQIYRLEGVLNVGENCFDHPKALDGSSDLMLEVFGERGRHTRMIWTNPVMPLNSLCLVYLFAELKSDILCK